MIKVCCDICMREIKLMLPQPQGSCLCEAHVDYGKEFYNDRDSAINKAIESHRNRFLQAIAVNKPKLEAVR